MLEIFLQHVNNEFPFIKFIMDIEVDGSLPFMDVLISKNDDISISHQVYCKRNHIEQYVHAKSHHHLT